MNCWIALEKKAKAARDQASDALKIVRDQYHEQQSLLTRTQELAEQYQRKLAALQTQPAHFGDVQLYRTSLKQLQHGMFQIQQEITRLEQEVTIRRRELTRTEIERQKFEKLIERERDLDRAREELKETRALDEMSVQMHFRKQNLA